MVLLFCCVCAAMGFALPLKLPQRKDSVSPSDQAAPPPAAPIEEEPTRPTVNISSKTVVKPEKATVQDFRLRDEEIRQVSSALLSGQSMLVLGNPGDGKTTAGKKIGDILKKEGYTVAIANYGGAAKETLVDICEQLGVPTETDDERPKPLTAQQLRDALKDRLTEAKTLLIADDAHRWSASLRYWLEDCLREGALLLLLAYKPPAKEIFLKLSRIEMQPLENDRVTP